MGNGRLCVNVGCGRTTTPGWLNFDNSLSVRLAAHPLLVAIASAVGLLKQDQQEFIAFVRKAGEIRFADAARRIPLGEGSVRLLYSSHMLEHLSRPDARRFLGEALRVLEPGGTLRLAVPDLALMAREYAGRGDADLFVQRTGLGRERPSGFSGRLRTSLVGDREHKWMYDGPSLCRLLESAGFEGARVVPAGATGAPDPGALDLREREDESVYVEALRPRAQPGPAGEGEG